MSDLLADASSLLHSVFGFNAFRPGQEEIVHAVLSGENVLAVMPTGSGKSLLYQLTSLVNPGVTVVVSPLIALIKDQLDKMQARGVASCKIDSTLTIKQRREVDDFDIPRLQLLGHPRLLVLYPELARQRIERCHLLAQVGFLRLQHRHRLE